MSGTLERSRTEETAMTTPTATRPLPGLPPAPRRDTGAALRACGVALAAALAVAGVYAALVLTRTGQRLDQAALDHLADGTGSRLTVASWLRGISVGGTIAILAGCVVVAVIRRHYLAALLAVALVAGANLTTQVLKHVVLERPHFGFETVNTLPSGHATVVTSLVLAALLIAPRSWRGLVSLVGAIAVVVAGVGTVVANWHRPSDVIAALLVCLAWGAAALAVISLLRPMPVDAVRPRTRSVSLVIALTVAAGLFLEIGVRPNGTGRDLATHAIIMCGLAIAGAIVVGAFARMVDTRMP
jgi:membrane-associated phospholipid phosphatase